MKWNSFAAALLALLLCAAPAFAADQPAAVLLLPESDMDRELADDLTEVLISAVLERSERAYRVQGKEVFRKTLLDRRTESGDVCLQDNGCIRQVGQEQGLALILVGKVGKAANGYRLEIWRLATTGTDDGKPYRKGIQGDIGKLIEEMELVAKWALAPVEAMMTVTVHPAKAAATVDGKAVPVVGRPFAVSTGEHRVAATLDGYEPAETTLTCTLDEPCTVALKLIKKKKVVTPDKPIEPPPEEPQKKLGQQVSTGTIVATSVLGGIALLSGGGSVWMYSRMKGSQSDANSIIDTYCPDGIHCSTDEDSFFAELDPVIDEGEQNALWANILGGVAAGAAVAAVTVLVIDLADGGPDDAPQKTTFAPHIGPDFSGFTLDVTF